MARHHARKVLGTFTMSDARDTPANPYAPGEKLLSRTEAAALLKMSERSFRRNVEGAELGARLPRISSEGLAVRDRSAPASASLGPSACSPMHGRSPT